MKLIRYLVHYLNHFHKINFNDFFHENHLKIKSLKKIFLSQSISLNIWMFAESIIHPAKLMNAPLAASNIKELGWKSFRFQFSFQKFSPKIKFLICIISFLCWKKEKQSKFFLIVRFAGSYGTIWDNFNVWHNKNSPKTVKHSAFRKCLGKCQIKQIHLI